jgi:2-polyprenyl-6-methoxyphenol hydroxylase-like FAD-dependent oxidoreductase
MTTARSSSVVPAEQRAIVIGASIAGLLAARVLSERYPEVLLLERDPLPEQGAPRKGTPHAAHPHGLLARGLQVIEDLFPGFTNALVARGALSGDIGIDVALDADRRRFARMPLGTAGLAASRLAIESELRRRVKALQGVRLMSPVNVLAPVHEAGRIVGVRLYSANDASTEEVLPARLVVDCTGRGSRSPQWLREWGYDPPEEQKVTIGLAYTSAYFRRDPTESMELAAVIGTATPGQPRPYILIAQEPDEQGQARWVLGVGGYANDHVEASLAGIRQRAVELGCAEIAALAEKGELIGSVMQYHFPHSQRRRFEKMPKFPAGYLVMGDAIASFNPVYGQGMAVAACEAIALRTALAGDTQRLAADFFKAAAKAVDIPWQLAVGGDLALPQVPGPRPFPTRLVNAYVGKVEQVAADDPQVAAAFIKVMHLLAPPQSLFAPAVAWRLLRHRQRPPPAASSPASAAAA